MQMQLQQIQTTSGPQWIAIPTSQALQLPTTSMLVQGAGGALHVQSSGAAALPMPALSSANLIHQQPNVKPKKSPFSNKRPKPIKHRSDSSTSASPSREDMSPNRVSPKVSILEGIYSPTLTEC